MQTIWKFPLELTDNPTVKMPRGARVLSAGVQDDRLMLWAFIPDTKAKTEERGFYICGTGGFVPDAIGDHPFIGTVQMGAFVWHVFDQIIGGDGRHT